MAGCGDGKHGLPSSQPAPSPAAPPLSCPWAPPSGSLVSGRWSESRLGPAASSPPDCLLRPPPAAASAHPCAAPRQRQTGALPPAVEREAGRWARARAPGTRVKVGARSQAQGFGEAKEILWVRARWEGPQRLAPGDWGSPRRGKHEPKRRRWRPNHLRRLLPHARTLGPLRSHSSPPSPQRLRNSPTGVWSCNRWRPGPSPPSAEV